MFEKNEYSCFDLICHLIANAARAYFTAIEWAPNAHLLHERAERFVSHVFRKSDGDNMCLTGIVHRFFMSDSMHFDLTWQRMHMLRDGNPSSTTLLAARLLQEATVTSERFKELVFCPGGFYLMDCSKLKQRLSDIRDVKGQ